MSQESKLGVLSQSSQKNRAELDAALSDTLAASRWVICACGLWHPAVTGCPDGGEVVDPDG